MTRACYSHQMQAGADRAKEARIEEYFARFPKRVKALVTSADGRMRQAVCVDVAADATEQEIITAIANKAVIRGEIEIIVTF